MEAELSKHLFVLVDRFGAARQLSESTIGRLSSSDGRFFTRIREGKTFTAKKYDEVVTWFHDNWPDGANWPDEVPRPEVKEAAE